MDNLHHKMSVGDIECKELDGRLIIYGWASVPVIDRSSEFIDGTAFDLSEYQKNPVYLWCHDRKSLPLGKANVNVKTYNGTDSGLYGSFEHDPNNPFAVQVYHAYRGGYLRGFSVGFAPQGREYVEDGTRNKVLRFTGAKLYEISAVPIPDNASSLAVPVVKELMQHMPHGYREKMLSLVPNRSTFFGFKGSQMLADTVVKDAESLEAKEMNDEMPDETMAVDAMETTADVGQDKPGPSAFRHVIDGCLKAISDGMQMVSASDHPQAGAKMAASMQKLLKALKGSCSTASGMWDGEGFDEMETKIAELIGGPAEEDTEVETDDEFTDEGEGEEVDMDAVADDMDAEVEGDEYEEEKGVGIYEVTQFVGELTTKVETNEKSIADTRDEVAKALAEQREQFESVIADLELRLFARIGEVEQGAEALADTVASLNGVQI